MTETETTFSEELMQSKTWRIWLKENWVFMLVIGLLSLLSLILLIQNQWMTLPTSTEELSVSSPPSAAIPQFPKKIKKRKRHFKNPLEVATHLFENEKIDQAISLLLETARENPSETIREKASILAKKIHEISRERLNIKKSYLEGYVLFQTHPQKACEKWKKILTSHDTREDTYYLKTKKRWGEACVSSQ